MNWKTAINVLQEIAAIEALPTIAGTKRPKYPQKIHVNAIPTK